MHYGGKVYLEGEDAENLKPGEKITMINWGNMLVDHISRSDNKVSMLCWVDLSIVVLALFSSQFRICRLLHSLIFV